MPLEPAKTLELGYQACTIDFHWALIKRKLTGNDSPPARKLRTVGGREDLTLLSATASSSEGELAAKASFPLRVRLAIGVIGSVSSLLLSTVMAFGLFLREDRTKVSSSDSRDICLHELLNEDLVVAPCIGFALFTPFWRGVFEPVE